MNSDENSKCAPYLEYRAGSCINLHLLVEMAKAYNISNPQDPITLDENERNLDPDKFKQYIVKEFTRRFEGVCKTQACWLEQEFMKNLKDSTREILRKFTFRPKGPSGKFEWLSNHNIEQIMKQYEIEYPEYKFMGAVPIDFDDLPALGIVDYDYGESIAKGKTKLGFVFNLDEHYKSGSHWVAMYVDLTKGQIYYFDSVGIEPDNRVRVLMRRINKFLKDRGVNTDVKVNTIRHQRGNSECGVYSTNFIIRMLKGDTFDKIVNNPVKDKTINKCRKVYFSKV